MINTKERPAVIYVTASYQGTYQDLFASAPAQTMTCYQVARDAALSMGLPTQARYSIFLMKWSNDYMTAIAILQGVTKAYINSCTENTVWIGWKQLNSTDV